MSDWGEPKRWHEASVPEEVRAVLESAVVDEPSPARLAALEARLGAQLGWPGGGGGSGGGASGGSGGTAAAAASAAKPLIGAALLVGLFGVGTWILTSPENAAPEPEDRETSLVDAEERNEEPSHPVPEVFAEPASPESEPEPPFAAPTPRGRSRPRPSPSKAPAETVSLSPPAIGTPSTLAEELRLVDGMREVLDADPVRSLALARDHQARFPHGALAPERELLAIEALLKLDLHGEAVPRAAGFLRRHGLSPHARSLRRLLEEHEVDLDRLDNPYRIPPISE